MNPYIMFLGKIGRKAAALGLCCPINTATTHIGSSCACSGGQSHFGLVLVTALGQSKAVPDSHPEPIISLFRAVVTLTAKWLYYSIFNQWPSSFNY